MRARLIVSFALVYVVWGSTYFAIRVGLETLTPFALGAIRFIAAGGVLYAWSRFRGAPAPSPAQWRVAALTGALMLLLGNGAVIFAEQRAPSGLVALMVTSVPLWMVLLEWLRPGGTRPDGTVIAGLAVGSLGIVLLVDPVAALRGAAVPPFEALILLVGTVSWAAGSLYSRHHKVAGSATLLASLQMLAAGVLFSAVALARGEFARLDLAAVTLRSWLAVGYLAAFGSIAAYSAYIWLTRAATPARLATYAYVNPVVALFLGATFAGERVTPRVLLAASLVLAAVVAITAGRDRVRAALRVIRGTGAPVVGKPRGTTPHPPLPGVGKPGGARERSA
jgi:drug/metabolite transporter (DMT)-like permease